MRRSYISNAAFTIILPLLVICLASVASAQVISVEPSLIDFGNMNQRESKSASVTITNNGAGLLELGRVSADCGCTVPTLAEKSLKPGQSTTMEVKFNSKNFNGNIIKMVTIHSNDPSNPRLEVMISAKVLATMTIEPEGRRITFESSPQGQVQTLPITFTSKGPDPLKLTVPAKSKKGLFALKIINGHKGDPLVSVVEVSVPANAAVGRHQDMVRIRTNTSGMESVDFYLSSWVMSELTLDTEAVKFRFKKTFNKTISISPTDGKKKFKITGVEIDMPEISVSFDNTKNGIESKIHLTGKVIEKTDPRAVSTRGRLQGTLLIHTDLESLPTIEVPVSYMLRM